MNGRSVWKWLLLVVPLVATSVAAQAPPEPGAEGGQGELRREMRKFFGDRLRADLDLTDEQVGQIMPHIQTLERERGTVRRERMRTIEALRDASDHGGTDDELQTLLDRFDEAERQQLELRQTAYDEIDRFLGVRQRVRLRFFMEDFPRMMREKIQELRGGQRSGRDRGAPPRPRPPRERP